MPDLQLERTDLAGGWTSIAVEGEIDLANADELAAAIEQIYSGGSDNLVIDLNGSSFMDSTGLKTLVMADRRFVDDKRQFAIAVSGGPVSRLIDLSGVESSIRVVSNVDEVLSG